MRAPNPAALSIGPIDLPGPRTMGNLMLGGLVGLLVWEVWARVLTKAVLGYPLQPAGLIDAILNHNFSLMVPWLLREALHYGIGIIGYPLAYFILRRLLGQRFGLVLDIVTLVWFSIVYIGYVRAGTATPLMFIFWTVVLMLVASRALNANALIADSLSWGNFTWVNALAIMAPIGGLTSFLLGEGGELSYMSFFGHVVYGALAAYIFEKREAAAM